MNGNVEIALPANEKIVVSGYTDTIATPGGHVYDFAVARPDGVGTFISVAVAATGRAWSPPRPSTGAATGCTSACTGRSRRTPSTAAAGRC